MWCCHMKLIYDDFFKKLFLPVALLKIWKIMFPIIIVFMSQVSYSKLIFQGSGVMGYNIITIIIVWNLLFENEEVRTSFFASMPLFVPFSISVLLLEPISHNMINLLKRNTIRNNHRMPDCISLLSCKLSFIKFWFNTHFKF